MALAAVDLLRPLPAAWFAPVEGRRVLDRDGVLLAERAVPERGRATWVELDQIAPIVVDALVASEDHRFGHHPGIDPISVVRAAWHDLRAGAVVEGGSSLHQQTARLLAGRPAGLPGKVVEAWRALKLWIHLDDEEVLAWYLNRAYFGQGAWGIEAAARLTFGESAASLSTAEAATLIGLLPAPERLHPRLDGPAANRARDRVLERLVRHGRLEAEVAEEARREGLQLRATTPAGLAPHLVARVLDAHPDRAELRTTLDAELQQTVERIVRHQLELLDGREVDHAAVLVVHLPTSEVRAYVGSGDFAAKDGQVDAVRALRSPGSALKPFVYALGFEAGRRPSDVLFDVESRFQTTHGTWRPENYSGLFHGPVSQRTALGSSLNVPAVRLLEELGVAPVQERLVRAGFDGLRRPASQLGLGLALGDAEVTLEQLAGGYAALARAGERTPFRLLVDDPTSEPAPVFTARASGLVVDVLADPGARLTAFGRYGTLERGYPAAVKTGTSTDWRDNWTVGFTREWLVAVWVGNFDHRAMVDVSGVTGAAPIWASVLDEVTGGVALPFPPPPGVERREVCPLSGGAPGPGCPRGGHDFAVIGEPDRPTCTFHEDDGTVRWPAELAAWAAAAGSTAAPGPPSPDAGASSITYPRDGAVLWLDPRLPPEAKGVPLRAAAPGGSRSATWTIDGTEVGAGPPDRPYLWRPSTSGRHEIALAVDGRPAGVVRVEVRGVGSSW